MSPHQSIRVGCLTTKNQDSYPALGAYWVQIWEGERVVARIYGDTPEHARSMARCFATAPELLDALQELFLQIEETSPEAMRAAAKAQAAIAKATAHDQ